MSGPVPAHAITRRGSRGEALSLAIGFALFTLMLAVRLACRLLSAATNSPSILAREIVPHKEENKKLREQLRNHDVIIFYSIFLEFVLLMRKKF